MDDKSYAVRITRNGKSGKLEKVEVDAFWLHMVYERDTEAAKAKLDEMFEIKDGKATLKEG